MSMILDGHTPSGGAARAVGPDCPQNWYLLARSAELDHGAILARRLGALDIVVYRGLESGHAVTFAAHCVHAGCHLRHGEVIGDDLQCALHRRVIRADGRFIAQDRSPLPTAPQPCLPTIERFGCIFVFAGETAAFDLPAPDICALGPVTTRVLPSQSFPLPWSTLIANGMDIDHLQAVHDRKLCEPPALRRLDRYRMRLDYRAQVTGRHLSDRMMKWIANDDIRTSITCIGGSMMLVESSVGRHRTFVILSMCPDGGSGSTIRAVVGVTGAPERLSRRAAARGAAWLFHAFLKKDVGVLHEMQWHEPETEVTQGDALTRSLCAFFRSLPAFAPAPEQPAPRAPLRAASGGT